MKTSQGDPELRNYVNAYGDEVWDGKAVTLVRFSWPNPETETAAVQFLID